MISMNSDPAVHFVGHTNCNGLPKVSAKVSLQKTDRQIQFGAVAEVWQLIPLVR
jgi:hypothetical protein